MTLWTFGHGTASAEELAALLRQYQIETLVDVRKVPKSRTHPHVWSDQMERWVPQLAGASYQWHPEFGGFRKADPDSPNIALRNSSFRAYADYMQTPAFLAALDALVEHSERERVAIMCSESVWWRCHRRLIADAAVLLHHTDVQHIMHTGKATPHSVTQGARLTAARGLVYDVP